MVTKKFLCLLIAALSAAFFGVEASAQFKEQAFSQQYNADSTAVNDTADVLFSLKDYFASLKHKQEMKIGTMFAGSTVFIGGSQIYNREYWKLPIVYGTIAGGVGAGLYFNHKGDSKTATYCFLGAGVAYWATLMDGVVNYSPSEYPHAGKATLYSVLIPGLGQIYNHDYWKLPIYLGAMGFGVHYYLDNNSNYQRFRNIYKEATASEGTYDGPITADQALYYRNIYRRYRDYSVLAIAALYFLQIMDANVFSYMHNFEVDDDISLKVAPTVLLPDNQYASANPSSLKNAAFGMKIGVRF